MKTKVILIILLLLSNGVYAQKTKGLAGFMKFGYTSAPGSASTFQKIAPEGVSGFHNSFFLMGADGYYRTGKIILALDGNIGVQGTRSSGNRYTEPYVGAGHAKFGWIVRDEKRYWIYPSIGTGTSFTILTDYYKIDNESENVHNKILTSPSFDIGLNGDFIIAPDPGDRLRYGSFLLGFRVGYRASVSRNKWIDEDGDRLYHNPYYSNNAFYVALSIGGGWFYTKSNRSE